MYFRRMLIISRPIFWFWPLGAYLLGIGDITHFTLLSILELLFFMFPLNFYLYGVNDMYDMKSDTINPRKGDILGAKLTSSDIQDMKRFLIIFPVTFIMIVLLSFNIEHIVLSCIFILLGLMYSHKKIRLKEIPIIDTVASASIYLIPFFIAYSLHDSVFTIDPVYLILILPVMGGHALTTLIDYHVDARAGMMTTAIFLGRKKTLLFLFLCFLIPLIFFLDNAFLITVLFFGLVWSGILLFTSAKEKQDFLFAASVVLGTLWAATLFYFFLMQNI